MSEIVANRPIFLESGRLFDAEAYAQTLSASAEVVDFFTQRSLDTPADVASYDSIARTAETFWGRRVLADVLSHPETVDTALEAMDNLLRLGDFSTTRGGRYSFQADLIRSASARHLFGGGLHNRLLDIADNEPESARASRIAELLLIARSSAPDMFYERRLTQFLLPRVPAILDGAAAAERRSEKEGYVPNPHAGSMYAKEVNDLLDAAKLHGALDTRFDDDIKQTCIAIASAEHDFAKEALLQLAASKEHVDMIATLLGVDGPVLRAAWVDGYGAGASQEALSSNEYRTLCVQRMLRLEAQEPGSVEVLRRRFGIRNFGRFPESMLLAQYQDRDKPLRHRVALISGLADGNGSSTRNSMPKFAALAAELRNKDIGFTVIEVDTIDEAKVFARQARMAHSLGKWPLLACMMIDSHGGSGGVALGRDWLTDEDVYDWLGEAVAEITRDDAVLFIDACWAAMNEDALAPVLAEWAGREVRGAEGGIFLRTIGITIDDTGRPQVKIEISSRHHSNALCVFLPAPKETAEEAFSKCDLRVRVGEMLVDGPVDSFLPSRV
jgi:hypothetical protein